jgi:cytochrome b subunit of formate dehydrogenase
MRHAIGVRDQQAAFADRLKRINSGKQYEHEDIIGHHTQKRFNHIAKSRPKYNRTFGQKLMIVVAFCAGMTAMLAGRLVYYHLSKIDGLPEAFYDLQSRGMFLFAVIIAGILTVTLHLSTKGRMYALAMGCALMHFGESAAAATMPALWDEMFSPEYRATVVSSADTAPAAG